MAGDKPVEILTTKRMVKPSARLKEAQPERSSLSTRRASSSGERGSILGIEEAVEEEDEGGEKTFRRSSGRRVQSAENSELKRRHSVADGTMAEEDKSPVVGRSGAKAAQAASPSSRSRQVNGAGNTPKSAQHRRRDDKRSEAERLAELRREIGQEFGQRKRLRLEEHEANAAVVMLLDPQQPVPMIDEVAHAVKPRNGGPEKMEFVCRLPNNGGLVLLTRQQILQQGGINLLLDFYESKIVLTLHKHAEK